MKPDLIATYRIQLHADFGFREVSQISDYLAQLGISHVYTSPYLQAAQGSQHGYDVVDTRHVNEELGGSELHLEMCETLQNAGLGHVIDVVPNHMAIAGRQNPWWWDVLESGVSSVYANYFDVDWENTEERWPNKILLPVLGDHYGRVLERGEFKVSYEAGRFILNYYEQTFPIDTSSLATILSPIATISQSDDMAFLAQSCANLPGPTVTARHSVKRRHRDKAMVLKLLRRLCDEQPDLESSLQQQLARLNGDYDALDDFIQLQNYRLAHWRTASRDLGYRRFFDITDLAGIRVEDPTVFADTHGLPMAWVQRGFVQGLRIDHPDGLRDPTQYFQRLSEACPDTWIVAEKILEHEESLPQEWPIAGTTGYDFLNLNSGLFINPDAEVPLNETYQWINPEFTTYTDLLYQCKRLILNEYLSSELNRLTNLFIAVCEKHRRHRDYTRFELQEALCETAVYFPVYRSYVTASDGGCSSVDKHYIHVAISSARQAREDLDPELFDLLEGILTLRIQGTGEGELAMRFQQLTGPAMAKGAEDTAFYRYHRLLCLNEVGGAPEKFGVDIESFHQHCAMQQRQYPTTMLASTTHDTKRSEDVRARLAVLSEIPELWDRTVRNWYERYAHYSRQEFPDRNTLYLLYQTLLGTWPIEPDRAWQYLEKAAREAKHFTSWTQPNTEYEAALQDYLNAILDDAEFRREIEELLQQIQWPAWLNSLAQTLVRLTAPGIPDIYQGTELWELSLVDPDNRRPVDFVIRQQILEHVVEKDLPWIKENMALGAPKMWTLHQALYVRRRYPHAFGINGHYTALMAKGSKAKHLLAFQRSDCVITLVPRLNLILGADWQDTTVEIPPGQWKNWLTDETFASGEIHLQQLFCHFPVALLGLISDENAG